MTRRSARVAPLAAGLVGGALLLAGVAAPAAAHARASAAVPTTPTDALAAVLAAGDASTTSAGTVGFSETSTLHASDYGTAAIIESFNASTGVSRNVLSFPGISSDTYRTTSRSYVAGSTSAAVLRAVGQATPTYVVVVRASTRADIRAAAVATLPSRASLSRTFALTDEAASTKGGEVIDAATLTTSASGSLWSLTTHSGPARAVSSWSLTLDPSGRIVALASSAPTQSQTAAITYGSPALALPSRTVSESQLAQARAVVAAPAGMRALAAAVLSSAHELADRSHRSSPSAADLRRAAATLVAQSTVFAPLPVKVVTTASGVTVYVVNPFTGRRNGFTAATTGRATTLAYL